MIVKELLLFFFVMFSERLNEARWTNIKTRCGMQAPYIAIVVFYFPVPYVSRDMFYARRWSIQDKSFARGRAMVSSMCIGGWIRCERGSRVQKSDCLVLDIIPIVAVRSIPVIYLVLLAVAKYLVKEDRPIAPTESCRFLGYRYVSQDLSQWPHQLCRWT